MNWKLKAEIQNVASLLPQAISNDVYYWIQRRFGNLKRVNPVKRMASAAQAWTHILDIGYEPAGKVFLEVGTGRIPNVPIAFWLMGARQIVTVDLNLYLRAELIEEMLEFVSENQGKIAEILGPFLIQQRMNELLSYQSSSSFRIDELLELCCIRYIAPGNATDTGLDPCCVDFHTSFRVLEHIRPDTLVGIFDEGNRIIREDGLFVHRIDYGDHFSYSDKSITCINFLQYSDEEWQRYAGNRYMYMNRLRHDDFVELFEAAGHEIVRVESDVDERSSEALRRGMIHLDTRFRLKSQDVLAISGSWILSRKVGR